MCWWGYPIGWNKTWKKGHMCTVDTSSVFSKIFFLLSLPMETRHSLAHGPGLVVLPVPFLLRLSVLRQNICYFSAPQPADCLYGTIQLSTMWGNLINPHFAAIYILGLCNLFLRIQCHFFHVRFIHWPVLFILRSCKNQRKCGQKTTWHAIYLTSFAIPVTGRQWFRQFKFLQRTPIDFQAGTSNFKSFWLLQHIDIDCSSLGLQVRKGLSESSCKSTVHS